MSSLKPHIARLADRCDLTRENSRDAFRLLMTGNAGEAEMAAFLMGLRVKGETVDEITGGAEVLREKAARLVAPAGAVDTCGTGGDGAATINVSTAAAIVTAAAGVPVAKHGNKAVSSRSGSADVLVALGVEIDLPEARVQACLDSLGIGFLHAPKHHGAMRHVAPVRRALGIRSIFNLLGPLANPAGTTRQVIGVFAEIWLEPLARTLAALGSEHVWIVHGSDGLDEISISAGTHVAEMRGGTVRRFVVTPEDAGLARHPIEAIRGGSAGENAAGIRAILAGEPGAGRDIVLLNAAAALIVGGRAADLREGVALAARAVDSGAAADLLLRWAAMTRGEGDDVGHAG